MSDRSPAGAYLAALRERLTAVMPRDMTWTVESAGRDPTDAPLVRVHVDRGDERRQPLTVTVRLAAAVSPEEVAADIVDRALRTLTPPRGGGA